LEYVSTRLHAASGSGIAFVWAECRAYTRAAISSAAAPSGICPASKARSSSSDKPALIDCAEWYQLQYLQPLTSVTTIMTVEECKKNLVDAIALILQDRREDAQRGLPPDAVQDVGVNPSTGAMEAMKRFPDIPKLRTLRGKSAGLCLFLKSDNLSPENPAPLGVSQTVPRSTLISLPRTDSNQRPGG